ANPGPAPQRMRRSAARRSPGSTKTAASWLSPDIARRRRRSDDLSHVVDLLDPPEPGGEAAGVTVRRAGRRELRELAVEIGVRQRTFEAAAPMIDLGLMQRAVAGPHCHADQADRE